MSRLFVPRSVPAPVSFGLLLVRVVTVVALGLHGAGKLGNLTGWMPESAGFPPALLPVAAIAEGIGGWLLAAGFLTPIAALGAVGVMAGAVWHHVNQGHPFVPGAQGGPSFELAASFLAGSVLVLLAGPGGISVDAVAFKRRGAGAGGA
ncbi:MAG: DoxX family protein [Planctomycetota bacterium]